MLELLVVNVVLAVGVDYTKYMLSTSMTGSPAPFISYCDGIRTQTQFLQKKQEQDSSPLIHRRPGLRVLSPIHPAGAVAGTCQPTDRCCPLSSVLSFALTIPRFSSRRLYCAPPASALSLGPRPTGGGPNSERAPPAPWGARAADRPSTSSAWGAFYPAQHGRGSLPSAGDSRRCWGWSVCWARFT